MTKPKIELRGVKYAAFASQETSCFEGTLYVDGKKFAHVSNDGHGGCDNWDPLAGARGDFDDAILALAKRINPLAIGRYTNREPRVDEFTAEDWAKEYEGEWWTRGERAAYEIVEGLVGHLLTEHLMTKDLTRAMKRKLLYLRDGKLFERKLAGPVPLVAQAVIEQHKREGKPEPKILNTLPLPEALAVWRSFAS